MIHCKNFQIAWRDSINSDDIKRILNREIAAIRIRNYYPKDTCVLVSERLMKSDYYGRYVNAPKIGRVGQAFFESQASDNSKKRYERMSVEWMQQIRLGCAPFISPIDKLRLELDEVWPPGAMLGQIGVTKMFAGLARHFAEGSEAEPHTDVLAWDAPSEPDAQELSGQIAANTYLTVPDKGGELTLWDVWPNKEQYEELRKPGSYGLRRDCLPEPIVSIKPSIGELILFHPQRVHAVEEIKQGSRVTWSNFIGHKSDNEPLTVWS